MNDPKAEATYYNPEDPLRALRELAARQPWFKKYSNTVTGSVGAVANIAWVLLSLGIDVPQRVAYPVFGLLSVLTALGLFKTPNGLPEKQVAELEEAYTGRHRKSE